MIDDTKITVADIMAMSNGQALYELLDDMFPYFSSISFNKRICVTLAKGSETRELEFNDLDHNHKEQFTVELDGVGMYIEVSFNDIMSLMTTWTRDNKLNQLGIK